MIFFITAVIVLLCAVYLLTLHWDKTWAKWTFAANMICICTLLVLFGLQIKIKIKQSAALRRTIAVALDVSASTGLKADEFKEIADRIWSDYSLEVIPFSDKLKGAEGAEATGMVSSLKSILAYISANYSDDNIAGFVTVSDGNETLKSDELNQGLQPQNNFPHNVVYLSSGSKSVKFDKSVSIIKAPRFIQKYSKEKVYFSVSVSGSKLEGVPVNLKLNGKNIGSTFVPLENGYGEGSIDLVIRHTGVNLLEASVSVDSRESVKSNNKDFAAIEGIYKGFRVLHISGHPSADTAFIRRGLQNIPGVDMISFYILRTSSQVNKTRENELSLIPFPTDQLFREELDNFDLIIINDFRLTEFLNPYYINNIVKFVESGGGLLILGGPLSFKRDDYLGNRFESILPVTALGNGTYENSEYIIHPDKITDLTALAEINSINGMKIKGLNRVNLKSSAVVFCRTGSGLPVIVGNIKEKARVLAVLTDSFWRFPYNAGISNETALRSLVRYTLGISSVSPVSINDNILTFNNITGLGTGSVYANIQFVNYDGTIFKNIILKPSGTYVFQESDSRMLNVSLEQDGRIIDKYMLLNYHEKKWHEHSYLPMGKTYLQNFAKNGNGAFVLSDKNELEPKLKHVVLRNPVVISEQKETLSPLYEHKGILLVLLYLGISSFCLKSRYMA